MTLPAWLQSALPGAMTWLPVLATLLHLALALAVTLHALLTRRNVSATVAWIGLAWLAPVVGALLYLMLGINRIQRAGVALKVGWLSRAPPAPVALHAEAPAASRCPA